MFVGPACSPVPTFVKSELGDAEGPCPVGPIATGRTGRTGLACCGCCGGRTGVADSGCGGGICGGRPAVVLSMSIITTIHIMVALR